LAKNELIKKEPIKVTGSLYRCPDCDYQSEHRIGVISHYRFNHMQVGHVQKKTSAADRKPYGAIEKTCCAKPEYRLLSEKNFGEKRVMLKGYNAVCLNCDELT